MQDFDGRTAVVTGAASGIGLALAEQFVRRRMRVVMADRHEDALASAAETLAGGPGEVISVVTDVADAASVDRLAETAASTFGDVHVLCNNAGVMRPGSALEQSLEDWSTVMSVNFWGVLNGIRAFVPAMLAHGQQSHVVNTASINGLVTSPQFASYIASKFAVVGLTETLAAEVELLDDAQLGVSLLCPAGVSTQIFASEVERRSALGTDEAIGDETQRRFMAYADPTRTDRQTPEDVAIAVLQAIRDRRFYVLPPEDGPAKQAVHARLATLGAALDGAGTSAGAAAVQAPGTDSRSTE